MTIPDAALRDLQLPKDPRTQGNDEKTTERQAHEREVTMKRLTRYRGQDLLAAPPARLLTR